MTEHRESSSPLGAAIDDGDVLVRNHDPATDHDVAVRLYGPDGGVFFESRFDLASGATAARPADLEAGTYTVETDCDCERYLVRTCYLDDDEGLLIVLGDEFVDIAPWPVP